ncbi:MAG: hypothetical protein IKQ35_03435 [Bacilli bacterium]|nr:hypothetical protein [Bacilli bacterium]
MKKKILFLLLLVLFVPTYVNAQCSSSLISGGGSSHPFGSSTGSGCDNWDGNTCINYPPLRIGMRFQVYKVTSKSNIVLLGKGADVWGVTPNDGMFTKPSNNNLNLKINDCSWPGTLGAARAKRAKLSVSGKEYRTGKYGNVYYDSSLATARDKYKVATWAFDYYHDRAEPKSGWLKTNFFDPLLKGDYATVKSIFKMSDKELQGLLEKPKNYYVTAEVMYQYIDAHNGTYFHGTPSETGYTHGSGYSNNILITTPNDPDVDGLVPKYIKKVWPSSVPFENWGYHPVSIKTVCNYAYGWEAWNIKEVCKDCAKSCKEDCKNTKADTAGRVACAVAWCNGNKTGSEITSCINECREGTPKNIGCVSSDGKKCDAFRASRVSTSEKTKACKDFNKEKNGGEITLEANVCYDDNKSFNDKKDESYVVTGYNYQTTKYYKITCNNKMNFKNLPNNQYIYLDSEKPMYIQFSYRLDYTKTCTLYYRSKPGSSDGWTENYNNSLIKYDIDSLAVAKKAAEKKIDSLTKEKAEKKEIDIQKKVIENIAEISTQLNNTKNTATQRLKTITDDKAPDNLKANKITLRKFDYKSNAEITDLRKTTVQLIPIVCKTDSKVVTEERLICLTNAGTNVTNVKIDGNTYLCNGEGGTAVKNTNTRYTYKESVIYTTPDSYVGAHTDDVGPFTEKEECQDAISTPNGFCQVVKYSYALAPFDGNDRNSYIRTVNAANKKIVLEFEGGSCDEFKLTYNCDYDFEENYCEACAYITNHNSEAYKKCLSDKCSCDSFCGANQVCRSMYCPQLCEGCNWKTLKETDSCDDCDDMCGSLKTKPEKYLDCFYDECCNKKCNGNLGCLSGCCVSKCNEKYAGNTTAIEKCIITDCPRDNSGYLYRSISQANPFPDRGTTVGSIGLNWYNKEQIITDADNINGRYYDKTSGMNDEYEYSFDIDSNDLKAIRRAIRSSNENIAGQSYKGSTAYKFFKQSTKAKGTKSRSAYCSQFLNDQLKSMNIDYKSTDVYCK